MPLHNPNRERLIDRIGNLAQTSEQRSRRHDRQCEQGLCDVMCLKLLVVSNEVYAIFLTNNIESLEPF